MITKSRTVDMAIGVLNVAALWVACLDTTLLRGNEFLYFVPPVIVMDVVVWLIVRNQLNAPPR